MYSNKARKVREKLERTGVSDYEKAEIILRLFTQKAGINPSKLRLSPKTPTICRLRDDIGEILATETNLSLREIGELIGRRHFRRKANENEE